MRTNIIKRAIALTKKSDDVYPHSAVLFDNRGNIISEGWNLSRHPYDASVFHGYPYPTIHAEFLCLMRMKRPISGLNILVIRVNKRGELMNSRPCKHCMRFLRKFDIKRVYYSNSEGEIKCLQ